jgi:acid phosphatase family membrane protein YuiD
MNNALITLGTIVNNKFVYIPLLAMAAAQLIKLIYYFILEHRLNFKLLFSTGNMPSSHSSLVAALATAVGLQSGFDSAIFGIAFAFASIVMYDAAGIRRAAGKQARILNRMVDDLLVQHHFEGERLKEFMGHTPIEVYIGMALGIAVALFLY